MISFLFATLKENGFKWIARRSLYELQRKIKWHNLKFKARQWRSDEINFWLKKEHIGNKKPLDVWRKNRKNFFFDAKDKSYHTENLEKILNQKELTEIVKRADSISNGSFHYFSSQKYNIGFPPDWSINPKLNKKINSDLHWNNIGMYSTSTGDVNMYGKLEDLPLYMI